MYPLVMIFGCGSILSFRVVGVSASVQDSAVSLLLSGSLAPLSSRG